MSGCQATNIDLAKRLSGTGKVAKVACNAAGPLHNIRVRQQRIKPYACMSTSLEIMYKGCCFHPSLANGAYDRGEWDRNLLARSQVELEHTMINDNAMTML